MQTNGRPKHKVAYLTIVASVLIVSNLPALLARQVNVEYYPPTPLAEFDRTVLLTVEGRPVQLESSMICNPAYSPQRHVMYPTAAAERLPAFPGAQGFGAFTPGGRGGKVLFVTNLNDNGPGSLRAACTAKGPRIIVFRVSGNIDLKDKLEVTEPFLTIAGQTAPGDGLCLCNDAFVVGTHDVVVRHLRFRPGDTKRKEVDAVSIRGRNIVFDHCSASWAVDEVLSPTPCQDVTIQWCIISEALNESVHHKGAHGYGSLITGPAGGITFHHNIYAHNNSRNPRPGAAAGTPPRDHPRFPQQPDL